MAKSTTKDSMTLAQVARHLHMGETTVMKLVSGGQLPAEKVGGKWRFERRDVEHWVAAQRAADTGAFDAVPDGTRMPLGDLLTDDSMVTDLRATDALGVIEELAARAYSNNWLRNKPWFIGALVERESLSSTAMDGGVAFLHTRERDHKKIKRPFIVFGRSYQGIDFGAPDGRPTYLFFLLGLTSDKMHLPILGRLARILKNPKTVARLRSTSSLTVIRSTLLKEDDAARKGNLTPVEFPDQPMLNREVRKRAIMRVAMKQREAEKAAKKKATAAKRKTATTKKATTASKTKATAAVKKRTATAAKSATAKKAATTKKKAASTTKKK